MRGLEIRKRVCFSPSLYYTTYKCKHILLKASSNFDLSLLQKKKKKKGQVKHWCSQKSGISGTPVRTTITNPNKLTATYNSRRSCAWVQLYNLYTTTTTSSGIHSLWSSLTHSNIYLAVTYDWFQIGKGVHQGCLLSPSLFNFYAEYIMRNAGLEDTQAGIKIAGRNINNLRYADDTTLMAESEEELKSLLMRVKEESEKVGLKLNLQKMKIMASGPITSWEIDGETVFRLSFSGLQNHCRWWLQPWN